MHHAGLHGLPGNRRRRTKHLTPSVANLVERKFTRQARDQLWVTDITERPTFEGKVYCAVVLDAFSRRVVGWSIDASPTAALTTNALAVATGNRSPRPGGTIIHSDHGVQCESWAFTQRARASGLQPSKRTPHPASSPKPSNSPPPNSGQPGASTDPGALQLSQNPFSRT
ncbi:DDE-type integrase/transposase/recombinase [Streptomyces sp. NPDC127044]